MNTHMNPSFFNEYAVREKKLAVDGGTIAPGEFVGCVLLEVEDHMMGRPQYQVWKVAPVVAGRHFTQLLDRSFKVDMMRLIGEVRPISRQRGRGEGAASGGRVFLSWVACQC